MKLGKPKFCYIKCYIKVLLNISRLVSFQVQRTVVSKSGVLLKRRSFGGKKKVVCFYEPKRERENVVVDKLTDKLIHCIPYGCSPILCAILVTRLSYKDKRCLWEIGENRAKRLINRWHHSRGFEQVALGKKGNVACNCLGELGTSPRQERTQLVGGDSWVGCKRMKRGRKQT